MSIFKSLKYFNVSFIPTLSSSFSKNNAAGIEFLVKHKTLKPSNEYLLTSSSVPWSFVKNSLAPRRYVSPFSNWTALYLFLLLKGKKVLIFKHGSLPNAQIKASEVGFVSLNALK